MNQPYPAEAVRELNERADWLKSEYLKGGNYEILKAREDECRYLTKKFAALLSYVEGMKWRPIESLPFDDVAKQSSIDNRWGIGWSETVLFYVPSLPNQYHRIVVGRLEGGMWLATSPDIDGCMQDIEGHPTNWMPLPLPPAPDGEG